MPKAEKGTAKYLANAMKSKGLQKLKWWCQVCEKQCRDDNGFKCHMMSEAHLRQMLVVGENAGKHISDYSMQFQSEFITLLSRRWGTKRVKANTVYQEYIQDKMHLHMNATRWGSLTEFLKYLGRAGIIQVEDTEKGWFVSWVDNTPKTLSKQAAYQNKERADRDDEQRQRRHIQEQIERAQVLADAQAAATAGPVASGSGSSGSGSQDEDDTPEQPRPLLPAGPIKLSFALVKKEAPVPVVDTPSEVIVPLPVESTSIEVPESAATDEAPSGSAPLASLPSATPAPIMKINPLKKSNPLKNNPLKSSKTSTSSSTSTLNTQQQPRSAVEEIMKEDLERKRRRDERDRNGGEGFGKRIRT